jgi:hypothetical protein
MTFADLGQHPWSDFFIQAVRIESYDHLHAVKKYNFLLLPTSEVGGK